MIYSRCIFNSLVDTINSAKTVNEKRWLRFAYYEKESKKMTALDNTQIFHVRKKDTLTKGLFDTKTFFFSINLQLHLEPCS